MTTTPELLSHLRVVEQFLLELLDELDPDSMPIDEVIEMFFDLAELQQVCASAKSKLERIDPGVAERAQHADASADALHDGLLSGLREVTRRGGAPGA